VESAKFVILDGPLFVTLTEEKPIAEHSTMRLLRYFRDLNTEFQWIYGVWVYWPMNF